MQLFSRIAKNCTASFSLRPHIHILPDKYALFHFLRRRLCPHKRHKAVVCFLTSDTNLPHHESEFAFHFTEVLSLETK
jgi:hypothetical protein